MSEEKGDRKTIAKIHLGMTFDNVCALLGPPDDENSGSNLFQSIRNPAFLGSETDTRAKMFFTKYSVWRRPEGMYTLVFEHNKVAQGSETPEGAITEMVPMKKPSMPARFLWLATDREVKSPENIITTMVQEGSIRVTTDSIIYHRVDPRAVLDLTDEVIVARVAASIFRFLERTGKGEQFLDLKSMAIYRFRSAKGSEGTGLLVTVAGPTDDPGSFVEAALPHIDSENALHDPIPSDKGIHGGGVKQELERQLREVEGSVVSLMNDAIATQERGDLDGALRLFGRAEAICRELRNSKQLVAVLGYQTLILKERGDLDAALRLFEETESLCRKLGDSENLAAVLVGQASIWMERGDLDGALRLYGEAEVLQRKLGESERLVIILMHQAQILRRRGDLDRRMSLLTEHERICRKLGISVDLAFSLAEQAMALVQQRKMERAVSLAGDARQLAVQHGLTELAQSMAKLLSAMGRTI